jgi:hypothetical protein
MSLEEKIKREYDIFVLEAQSVQGTDQAISCLLKYNTNIIEILSNYLIKKEQNEDKKTSASSGGAILQADQTNGEDGI